MSKFIDSLVNIVRRPKPKSRLRSIAAGSFYKISDLKSNTDYGDIKSLIDKMRALAKDSQVATALAYYATDATLTNSANQIIWATPVEDGPDEIGEIVNALFKRWKVNSYARSHILELATIGNLYIPTSHFYRRPGDSTGRKDIGVSLDSNTIPESSFDIIPSTKIPPENIVHLWLRGEPQGYLVDPEDTTRKGYTEVLFSEDSVIHFSLGGLLGDYVFEARNSDGEDINYDIQFAEPLMEAAVQPTQILNLLEDASVLASLVKVVRFINIDCGNETEEDEMRDALQQIKDAIEQQLSLNTSNGDTQSFLNPQSPNNLIYLPKVNGQDAVSVTDLNMRADGEESDKLLNYYQDKKLSVLGIPKEALNFSSAEGLGGAGAVMSQRSALYANALQRIETAYKEGWTSALNAYFRARNLNGYIDKFELHMQPILTEMSSIQFDKRGESVNQASAIVDLLKALGVKDADMYKTAITEILQDALPKTSSAVNTTNIDLSEPEQTEGF
jgi:hypothetical protein